MKINQKPPYDTNLIKFLRDNGRTGTEYFIYRQQEEARLLSRFIYKTDINF